MRELLLSHGHRYPEMMPQDAVKLLYQSAFGPGHLIRSERECRDRLQQEQSAWAGPPSQRRVEPLAGGFARFYPAGLQEDETSLVSKLFCYSSTVPVAGQELFNRGLTLLVQLTGEGRLPFSIEQLDAYLKQYPLEKPVPVHHSQSYRQQYRPFYRLLCGPCACRFQAFAEVDRLRRQKRTVTIAIEGGAATGKTTLGRALAGFFQGTLLHTDDFFLRPEQRTEQRYLQPGGNLDYERMREDVVVPLESGHPFSFRPFDCTRMALGDPVQVIPQDVRIVEGSYSLHPRLGISYDLTIFLSAPWKVRTERILQRNGEKMLQRFCREWIPMEEAYFKEFRIPEQCLLKMEDEGA